MSDLLGCTGATAFRRLGPRSATGRFSDGAVTVAVVSSLAINTCIAVAALAGPISRSFARVEAQSQYASFVDQGRTGDGGARADEAATGDGR
jgi:hypothetical protein